MIYSNFNLKSLNSFGLNTIAKTLISIENKDDLLNIDEDYIQTRNLILGGGSNTIFVNEFFDGNIILIRNKGISIIEESDNFVIIDAYSGEVWNDVVNYHSPE